MTVAADEQKRAVSPSAEKTMKRVVVDHFGGPEVLSGGGRCSRTGAGRGPREGAGCRRVVHRFPAARGHVSRRAEAAVHAGLRARRRRRGARPGCSRLRVGGRIAALTVWGACAEFACVLEADAVEVPEDLDPAEVVGLVLTYMTAYQVLHREAKVTGGETVLVHGAAGRVGTAVLELGALAGLRLYDCSAQRPRRGRAARRGGDRLPKRGLPGAGARGSPGEAWMSSTGSAARCRFAPSRAAVRRTARRVRRLLHARERREQASVDRVVCGDRNRRALGPALAAPAGEPLPDPEAA